MPYSFDNRWLLLGGFIYLAFHFNSNRSKTAVLDRLPEDGRCNGLARFKGYRASARVQIENDFLYALNAFDRTLNIVHSERTRQAADVNDGISGAAHRNARSGRRRPSRCASDRKGGGRDGRHERQVL